MAKISNEWIGDLAELQEQGRKWAVLIDGGHPSGYFSHEEAEKTRENLIANGRKNVTVIDVDEELIESGE